MPNDKWVVHGRAGDREGLEKLCRYVLRPPFSQERIERLADGRVKYTFRQPWPDGSTHLVLEPVEFLGKLAALVPPPRAHLVRYHGILAPHARRRREVLAVSPSPKLGVNSRCHAARVEGAPPPQPAHHCPPGPNPLPASQATRGSALEGRHALGPPQLQRSEGGCAARTCLDPINAPSFPDASRGEEAAEKKKRWRDRMRRADLLKRTLGLDVLECPRCGGRMNPIAEIVEPDVVAKILRAMGLPDVPPRASPARPPPQLAFDFDQVGS